MSNSIGNAAVYGVNGTLAFSGVATTTNKLVGAGVDDEFAVHEGKDGTGEYFGATASGRKHKATFDIIPVDPTVPASLATAKSNIKLPGPLDKVTIAGFGNNLLDGDWNYTGGGKIAPTEEGYLKVTLPCTRWGATPAAFNAVTV